MCVWPLAIALLTQLFDILTQNLEWGLTLTMSWMSLNVKVTGQDRKVEKCVFRTVRWFDLCRFTLSGHMMSSDVVYEVMP